MSAHEQIAEVVELDDVYERIHHKSRRVAAAAIHDAQQHLGDGEQLALVIPLPVGQEPPDLVA